VLVFLTCGDGYHYFHHIFPNDYRNGVRWWHFDPTKWLIALMSRAGLASNLKRVRGLWIQRAQLAMQFRRMESALETKRGPFGDEQVERFKARVAEKHEAFKQALDEWAVVRDEWVADRKRRRAMMRAYA